MAVLQKASRNRVKLWPARLPVRNTFIDFALPNDYPVLTRAVTCPALLAAGETPICKASVDTHCNKVATAETDSLWEEASTCDGSSLRSDSAEQQRCSRKFADETLHEPGSPSSDESVRESRTTILESMMSTPRAAVTTVPLSREGSQQEAPPTAAAPDVEAHGAAPAASGWAVKRIPLPSPAVSEVPGSAWAQRTTTTRTRTAKPTKQASEAAALSSCNVFVGIEEDEAFGVVRRLLGANGENIRRIVQSSRCRATTVRVRGRGSRCLEPPAWLEVDKPLMVTVCSASAACLDLALGMVLELLESVHKDYVIFCAEAGRPARRLAVRVEKLHAA